MPNIVKKTYSRMGRRSAVVLTAGSAAAAAILSGGVALAATSTAPAQSHQTVASAPASSQGRVVGRTVFVRPFGTASAIVICPVATEIFGGGETNGALRGAVVLTQSWPTTNASWGVSVKNNSPFTQRVNAWAVCR